MFSNTVSDFVDIWVMSFLQKSLAHFINETLKKALPLKPRSSQKQENIHKCDGMTENMMILEDNCNYNMCMLIYKFVLVY